MRPRPYMFTMVWDPLPHFSHDMKVLWADSFDDALAKLVAEKKQPRVKDQYPVPKGANLDKYEILSVVTVIQRTGHEPILSFAAVNWEVDENRPFGSEGDHRVDDEPDAVLDWATPTHEREPSQFALTGTVCGDDLRFGQLYLALDLQEALDVVRDYFDDKYECSPNFWSAVQLDPDGTLTFSDFVQRKDVIVDRFSLSGGPPPPVTAGPAQRDVDTINRHRKHLGMAPLDLEAGWTAEELAKMADTIRREGRMFNPQRLKRRLMR